MRIKDGKEHLYWSVVESVRTRRGVHQRKLLYLGELNDSKVSPDSLLNAHAASTQKVKL